MIPDSSPNQGTHRNMKASSAFKSLFALTRTVDVEPVFLHHFNQEARLPFPMQKGMFRRCLTKKIPININHSPELYPLDVHNRLKCIAQKQLSVTAEFSSASRKGSMYTTGDVIWSHRNSYRLSDDISMRVRQFLGEEPKVTSRLWFLFIVNCPFGTHKCFHP